MQSHAPIYPEPQLSQSQRGAMLAGTALTFLKPLFKHTLRPFAGWLARIGVTANQVTLASLVGSLVVSAFLCTYSRHQLAFAILPIWLLIRMACATVDGTLAIEFGQKSRLGGILNEAGDIVSDTALFLPLAFVKPFSPLSVLCLIGLIIYAEFIGIFSESLGCGRRLEGPLGKADRTIILAIMALTIAIMGEIPAGRSIVFPLLVGGLVLTAWNRVLFAFNGRSQGHKR